MKGKLLLAAGLAIYMTGCAAITPSHQNVTITTNIPDSVIMVNNERVGTGAVQTSVKRNKQLDITAYKKGYIPAHKTVGKHNNVQGCLDAAVCGLGLIIFALPWCISAFATPGAWSLDETNIGLFLQPSGEKLENGEYAL